LLYFSLFFVFRFTARASTEIYTLSLHDALPIFLTLTTPNVSKNKLENAIKHYNQSFRRLSNRTKFKKVVKGYVRKLEITYNKERDDYNPHFHVLVAVNKSYFKDTKYYISQKEWLNLWRDVTGMPEITQ